MPGGYDMLLHYEKLTDQTFICTWKIATTKTHLTNHTQNHVTVSLTGPGRLFYIRSGGNLIWCVCCQYKTGWFSEALLDNLRLRVAVRFVSVFPEPGFEDVFKSIQEEFERSEKTRIQKDALKPFHRNHQETTKGKINKEISVFISFTC